jgi:trimeric autotransporter adhesin
LNIYGRGNTTNGFQALRSNTGSIDDASFGSSNTAIGHSALFSNQTGRRNIAVGSDALHDSISDENTAIGADALRKLNAIDGLNTAYGVRAPEHGESNTAVGTQALGFNFLGSGNTAVGFNALLNNQGGENIALGRGAGGSQMTGIGNIYIGNAGVDGENFAIRIGGLNANPMVRTFIDGIIGNAVVGDTVVVDGNTGQLGTVGSAARFKKEIRPMDKASEAILALKPVSFHYKSDSKGTQRFGLIAEDVVNVNPDLVVRDRNGEFYGVRYEAVNAMLLNEFLKEHRTVQELKSTAAKQER